MVYMIYCHYHFSRMVSHFFVKIFGLFWQAVLFFWIAFVGLYNWLASVFGSFFHFGDFVQELAFFLIGWLLTPLLWWQALLVAILPMWIAIPVLGILMLISMFSLAPTLLVL